jgi:O-antigen ligase/polysaccharide polymerase Wzy-like membrane protein
VWPLAAFGGTHSSTAVPFSLACIAYTLARRPRLEGRLDAALMLLVGCITMQLVPLPTAVVPLVSPHAAHVRDVLALTPPPTVHVRPLSIRGAETEWALLVTAAAIAVFWLARRDFTRGGVRRTVRGVAVAGFAVSLLAIVQAATAGRYIYWAVRTEYEGPLPFGPFINRNHFATWVLMALPLTVGYIAARAGADRARYHTQRIPPWRRFAADARGLWLTVAAGVMLLALLLSLSRSGLVSMVVSGTATVVLLRSRVDPVLRRMLVLSAAAIVVIAMLWADVPALAQRLAGVPTGVANRLTIWRETLPIVRDFWATGTGAGTYRTAMLVYQQSDRSIYFNQAHDHYLQVAAEGGLLLMIPLVLALTAFARTARASIVADRSALLYLRAGAACGLVAVALQSLWETGLVMPANGVLAATLAAILVHEHGKRPDETKFTTEQRR